MQNAISEMKLHPKNKVLVHCAQGVSRSSTAIAVFLMCKLKIEAKKVVDYLKFKRHMVEPNSGFWAQLLKVEEAGYKICD